MLRADVPVRVEVATNRKSKIYHAGAAQQRIETALIEELGVEIAADAPVTVKARIDDNLVVLSVDTSGEGLHKRGHKVAVGKAPLRETMAAMFLKQSGFSGQEPVLDPMCGSGTFVIEAAEIAAGLLPGRSRDFAFQKLATFDAQAWSSMSGVASSPKPTALRFHGSDRDAGAFTAARANAERAGVGELVDFRKCPISDIQPPEEPAVWHTDRKQEAFVRIARRIGCIAQIAVPRLAGRYRHIGGVVGASHGSAVRVTRTAGRARRATCNAVPDETTAIIVGKARSANAAHIEPRRARR